MYGAGLLQKNFVVQIGEKEDLLWNAAEEF